MERSRIVPLAARPDTFAGTEELAEKAALRKIQRIAVGLGNVTLVEQAALLPVDDIPENIILGEE